MSVPRWLFYSDLGTKQWADTTHSVCLSPCRPTHLHHSAAHLEKSLCVLLSLFSLLLCNCSALHCASWISGSFSLHLTGELHPLTPGHTINISVCVFQPRPCVCECLLFFWPLLCWFAPRSPLRCCLLRTFRLCHTCQGDKRAKTEAFPRAYPLSLLCTYLLSGVTTASLCRSGTVGADLLLWTKPLEILSSNDGDAEPPRIPCNLLVTETQRTSIHETLINKTCTRGGVRFGGGGDLYGRWIGPGIIPADRRQKCRRTCHPQAVIH